MNKVLVTTDFSAASKSAIHFAIHWASQQKLELVFAHVCEVQIPEGWSKSLIENQTKEELNQMDQKLKTFIEASFHELGIKPKKYSTLIIRGLDADISVLYYVQKNPGFDCICISTRGAGKLKKFIGTNTGNLITKSEIPVLAIPANYKPGKIESVMYATDLSNFDEEIVEVANFAKPLKAKIEIVHFTWPNENLFNEQMVSDELKKKFKLGVSLHFEKFDAVYSLIQNLEKQINERNPSVVIMYTNQQRTFFEKIFLSSKTEEFSFKTKIPLLVFNKKTKRK